MATGGSAGTGAGTTVRGCVLGKFLPPHRGHQYLIDFARHHVDYLTVLCCTLTREPIAGALRTAWMREMFPQPNVNVVHIADDSLPQEPSEHPQFWDIWRDLVQAHCGHVDCFFASETYGVPMAAALQCEFVPVDIARELVPISGRVILKHPLRHWHYLPEPVRPYFAKKVCIFGPESTGKSTLAKNLAAALETNYVHEYARPLLDPKGGHCDESDLPSIARGQAAAEDALLRQCNRILVTDTDCLTTRVWSEVLFERVDPVVEHLASRTSDLYLLCDVDVPWVNDNQRYFGEPAVRRAMFDRFRSALKERCLPYVLVQGDWNQRLATAVAAVNRLLA